MDYDLDEILETLSEFQLQGTRRVPQFDTSDGVTHRDRENIGSFKEDE